MGDPEAIAVVAFAAAALVLVTPKQIYSRMIGGYFGDLPDRTQWRFGIVGIIFGMVVLNWI
jgi:hypothetical protein